MEQIFTHFISRDRDDDERRVGYLLWFGETFPDSEFKSEDLIMKKFCNYCAALEVPMKAKYFDVFMSTELKPLLINSGIRVPGTDNIGFEDPAGLQTAYMVTMEFMRNEFKILESYESDVDDFKVEADAFISQRLNQRVVEELGNTYEYLSSSENSTETVEYALDNFITLRSIYDRVSLEELDDSRMENEEFKFVCDTGIPVVDKDIIGIHTTQLYSIDAQPGFGKTRFLLGVWVYRAAVMYHKNVIYYQLEQTKTEAKAMLVARHVFTLYGLQVNADMIQFKRVPAELQEKVKAAELDLFTSGKYGKIYINNTDLYYNTLRETLRKDDRLHGPFDMIGIDYMGLIMQKTAKYEKELLEYEVIGRSYRKVKNYVRHTGKCAVVVSQFNDKGIQAGEADKEITPNMVQGGIAAYRHSDQNLALSGTKVMKAQQKIRISQPKIRGTAGFGSAVVDARLGICYFYQNSTSQV